MSNSVSLWIIIHQARLFIGFSRQEYWSELPFAPPRIFLTRDWTCVSCISWIGRLILYHWATWEAHQSEWPPSKNLQIINAGEDAEEKRTFLHCWWECTLMQLLFEERSFLGGPGGREAACQCRKHKRHGFNPWVKKIPWSRKWWTEERGRLQPWGP